MIEKNKTSAAELADHHRRLLLLAVLAVSVKYAASAAQHLVGATTGRYLDAVEIGMALLVIAIVLPIVLWKILRLPRGDRHLYFSLDGFVAQSLIRAHKVSWATTFILLALLETMTENALADIPPVFFLQLVLAVMLAALGGTFFFLNRVDVDNDPADESDERR